MYASSIYENQIDTFSGVRKQRIDSRNVDSRIIKKMATVGTFSLEIKKG